MNPSPYPDIEGAVTGIATDIGDTVENVLPEILAVAAIILVAGLAWKLLKRFIGR